MKSAALLLLLLFSTLACDSQVTDTSLPAVEEGVTTVILVRHAEKESGDDPVLTRAGTERAQKLQEMLATFELAAVYSSDTRRTRLTAEPTAQDHDLDLTIYDVEALPALASRIRQQHRGRTVLVVGHSNTTPELANYIGETEKNEPFSELDYGNVLVVTVPEEGQPRVTNLRF